MQFSYENTEPVVFLGTSSQQAEIGLIKNLLQQPFFEKPAIQRRLAAYPYENYSNKSELICELMDLLWPDEVKVDLFSIYKEFDYFMTATGRKGHFIHQFEVFLLGLNVLLCWWDNASRKEIFLAKNKEELFRIWLITSTTHDCGYPLQVAPDIVSDLSKLFAKLNMTSMADKLDSIKFTELVSKEDKLKGIFFDANGELVSEYLSIDKLMVHVISENLVGANEKDVNWLIEELKKESDHGYVSATIVCRVLLKVIVKTKDFQKTWLYKKLDLMLGAIVLHSLTQKEKEKYVAMISFDKNPYGYLLYLIDNLQDWSRAIVPNEKYAEYQLLNFKISNDELCLDYILSHVAWTDKIRQDSKDDINKRLKMLARLIKPSEKFNFKINVTFKGNDLSEFPPISLSL